MASRLAVDPRFGAELRNLRERRALSVRELAKAAPVSKSQIHDLETGRRRPTAEVAAALDQALGAGGRLAAMVRAAGPPPEVAERLDHVARHPRHVDPATLEALADLLAAQRRLEDSIGSAAVIAPVRAQLDAVRALAAEARCSLRHQLIDLAAQWAQFCGWLYAASGRSGEAGRWYHQAMEWATEVNNRDLLGTVLSFRGYLAEVGQQYGTAIGLSRTAWRDPTVYAGQRAYSAGQEARGLALAGAAQSEVLAALDRAAEYIAQQDPAVAPPWGYFYTPAFFACQRGIVHRHLGQYEHAVTHLTAGLGEPPAVGTRPEWAGPYLVHLAVSLAAIGERDQAGTVLDEAWAVAEATGSVVLSGRVRAAVRGLSARR